MIASKHEFLTSVRHLTSTTSMLTAMYLESKEKNDFALFPVTSEAYFAHIAEVNAEIREYLKALPQQESSPPAEGAREAA